MKLIVKEKKIFRLNRFIDWLLYMIGYTIVFVLVTSLFKTIYVDSNNSLLWSFIIVLIIYALNKTIKPILVTLTIPITGITLGLFYPCINVFILKLADWLLGSHFKINNLFVALFAAILLSITNFMMEHLIKRIINQVKKYE